jgi:DNA-binding phage protein
MILTVILGPSHRAATVFPEWLLTLRGVDVRSRGISKVAKSNGDREK